MSGKFLLQNNGQLKMMKVILFVFLCASLIRFPVQAEEHINCDVPQPLAIKAKCLLRVHELLRKTSPESFVITLRQIKKGDHYFKNKDFDNAYDAYDLARFNSPNVYAYLRQGDSVFIPLASATQFWDDDHKPTGNCLVPGSFVGAVDQTIANEYGTGIELAKVLKTQPPVSKATLAEAERKVACMTMLADQYRQAKTGCVDMEKVKACVNGPSVSANAKPSK